MRQRIIPGQEINAATPEELAEIFLRPRQHVMLGMGGGVIEEYMDDMPMKGTRRQVTSYSRGTGADNFIVPANVVTDLCPHSPRRLAGTITNSGSNPATVYLAYAARVNAQGTPGAMAGGGIICGYLFASGTFDFKLTNDVWCGPVSVWSLLGTTLVWGEH